MHVDIIYNNIDISFLHTMQCACMSKMASCEEYKNIFLQDFEAYQILALTVPQNLTVWTEKDLAWNVIFYVYSAVLAAAFLGLGVVSTLLLFKKDCVRLQSKIFVTVYTCIAILSFSRALWLALDPFGLVGFIATSFPGWFIISRSIEALGFPSLNASYTLMIVALLKINTKPGEPWHHQWKIILPVVFVIFIIVIVAEVIAMSVHYQGIIAILICEFLLAVAGVVVCVLFLFAGNRVLRKLNRSETKSMRLSDGSSSTLDPNTAERKQIFANKELQRHQAKTKRTKQKIVTITYATVVFSILYSLLTAGRAVLTAHLFFGSCLGYQGQQGPSSAWLVLEITHRVTEVVLALILLYSITDIKTICLRTSAKL